MSNSLEAKIVVLGSQGVGKTSLVHRYVDNAFAPPSTTSTIGASFLTKRALDVDTSTVVRLQLWDTAGQERFRSISKLYYRGANAGVLCYDVTSLSSFEEMGRWLLELKANLGDDIILHVVGTKSDIVAEAPQKRQVPFEKCIAYVAEQLYPNQVAQQQQQQQQQNQNQNQNQPGTTPPNTTGPGIGAHDRSNAIASPASNRSSGFWGQDIGWDCCHEISAKDGEGVDEVFRVITRKLVEQHQRKRSAQQKLLLRRPGPSGAPHASSDMPDPGAGSFRLGHADKRRSWLGFPTTPGLGTVSGEGAGEEGSAEVEGVGRGRRGGKCC